MNTFLKAIKDLTSDLLGSSLGNGIHWGTFSPRTGEWKDYCVLVPSATSQIIRDTGKATVEVRMVRFQFFSTSLATVGTYIQTLEEATRKISLALNDGNRIIDGEKEAEDSFLDPDRWDDGSEIWIGLIMIGFSVQRNFA